MSRQEIFRAHLTDLDPLYVEFGVRLVDARASKPASNEYAALLFDCRFAREGLAPLCA
jgi:hypothetical protein